MSLFLVYIFFSSIFWRSTKMQHYHAFVQQARCLEDNKSFSMRKLICEVLAPEILAIICHDMHLYITSDILDRVQQKILYPEVTGRFEFIKEILSTHPQLLSVLLLHLLGGDPWLYRLFIKQIDNPTFEAVLIDRAEPYLLDQARQLTIFQKCVAEWQELKTETK